MYPAVFLLPCSRLVIAGHILALGVVGRSFLIAREKTTGCASTGHEVPVARRSRRQNQKNDSIRSISDYGHQGQRHGKRKNDFLSFVHIHEPPDYVFQKNKKPVGYLRNSTDFLYF